MLSCRGGGKLFRPNYLAPNPLEYQSKIILLILLILIYLIVCLVGGGGGQDKLAWTAYPLPLKLSIQNNLTKKTAKFYLNYVYN